MGKDLKHFIVQSNLSKDIKIESPTKTSGYLGAPWWFDKDLILNKNIILGD